MLIPDFANQPYIAEVLRTSDPNPDTIPSKIEHVIDGHWSQDSSEEINGSKVRIYHGFIPSPVPYHRTIRNISNGKRVTQVTRTKSIRNRDHYLYDLLVAQRDRHIIVAVPFH